ncbi:hypothetical protein ACP70R_049967 [Stipagrostis hirtigluma subsp. patula]
MMDGREQQQRQLDLIMGRQSMAAICESEDALGSSESEPARTARPRGKRSRAAEVHNLSEKRRRSRINEKMKALQNLVPNSSKTDKASMLDDAIEYLKQLQLQVQMLSMRNGLFLPPANLSGAHEPLPASQMCDVPHQQSSSKHFGVVSLPGNLISGGHHSFDPTNHDQRQHKPLVLPSVPNTTAVEPQFLQESSQSSVRAFELTVSPEMLFQEDITLKHRLASTQETASVPGHEVKLVVQETSRVNSEQFDKFFLRSKQPQDMMPKNTGSALFMPYFHSLQSGDPEAGLRAGSE